MAFYLVTFNHIIANMRTAVFEFVFKYLILLAIGVSGEVGKEMNFSKMKRPALWGHFESVPVFYTYFQSPRTLYFANAKSLVSYNSRGSGYSDCLNLIKTID